MDFDDWAAEFKKLPSNLNIAFEKTVEENAERVVEANRSALFLGHDSNDREIASYQPYADSTKAIKTKQGKSPNIVNLKDTGSFYSEFYVQEQGNTFEFFLTSTDEKTPDLISKYGQDIFGLKDETKIEILKDDYIKNIVEGVLQKGG